MHLLIGLPVAALVLWLWLRGSLFAAILLTLAVLLALNGPDVHPAPGMLPLAILLACGPCLIRLTAIAWRQDKEHERLSAAVLEGVHPFERQIWLEPVHRFSSDRR